MAVKKFLEISPRKTCFHADGMEAGYIVVIYCSYLHLITYLPVNSGSARPISWAM